MNTNLIHNAINFLIALLAALELFDWTAFFPAEKAMMIVGVLALVKILINVGRDGIAGMAKEQPPVK